MRAAASIGIAFSFLALLPLSVAAGQPISSCTQSYGDVLDRLTLAEGPAPGKRSRSKFSSGDLLAAAMSIRGGTTPKILAPGVRKELRELAEVRSDDELAHPNALKEVLVALRYRMGEDDFERALGSQAREIKRMLIPARTHRFSDQEDMNRGWGWKLLRDNDKAFNDPRYLVRMLRSTEASGELMGRPQGENSPLAAFAQAWGKIAPANVEPKAFTLTGTDANNLLYDIADTVVARKIRGTGTAEILAFEGAYAGGGGRMAKLHFMNRAPEGMELRIPSPHTPHWNPKDPAEVARLKELEDRALREIEEKVKRGKPPIGGFLLEAVLGSKGVYFYRPEFLLRLRKLCDELEIPIFADEILTGGGRTGKFFAYQHYEGFEPDFVTFGKGLQVAGMATVHRPKAPWHPEPRRMVTLTQYDEALLKSAQVMNRIHDDHLMENAREVGEHFVQRLRKREFDHLHRFIENKRKRAHENAAQEIGDARREFKNDPESLQRQMNYSQHSLEATLRDLKELEQKKGEDLVRGIGTLIYSDRGLPGYQDAMGRLMPPMTITKEEVEEALLNSLDPR